MQFTFNGPHVKFSIAVYVQEKVQATCILGHCLRLTFQTPAVKNS